MSPEALNGLLNSIAVSPYNELLAYEHLYAKEGMTLKKMTELTVGSNLLPTEAEEKVFGFIGLPEFKDIDKYIDSKVGAFSVAVNRTPSWPDKLIDSQRPSPLLYYRGNIGLLDRKSVSVVGARKASNDGLSRAFKIARDLANNDITVVTGLAAGIDTAATEGAINASGSTIAVIGTPIDECYPKQNAQLQEYVAQNHLLISQVPFYRYKVQPFKTKRYYFPERNELMAAISDATIIVEASDTSGTLTQARACLHQKRPLFIMRSCFLNPSISWPEKYINKDGVYILEDVGQVLDAIR